MLILKDSLSYWRLLVVVWRIQKLVQGEWCTLLIQYLPQKFAISVWLHHMHMIVCLISCNSIHTIWLGTIVEFERYDCLPEMIASDILEVIIWWGICQWTQTNIRGMLMLARGAVLPAKPYFNTSYMHNKAFLRLIGILPPNCEPTHKCGFSWGPNPMKLSTTLFEIMAWLGLSLHMLANFYRYREGCWVRLQVQ